MQQVDCLTQLLASGKLADTHAHLDYEVFQSKQNLSKLLKRADAARVTEIWLMSVAADSISANLELLKRAQTIPHNVVLRLAIGFDMELLVPGSDLFDPQLYRKSAAELRASMTDQLINQAQEVKAAGFEVDLIGEVGLDYYWLGQAYEKNEITRKDYEHSKELQRELLDLQLRYAGENGLPVSIHTRGAERESLNIVKEWVADFPQAQFVFHSYTGPAEIMQEVLAMGGKIGINGIATYKSAAWVKQAVLRRIEALAGASDAELKHFYQAGFVLETDSPFLIPSNSDCNSLKEAYGEAANDPATVRDLLSNLGISYSGHTE